MDDSDGWRWYLKRCRILLGPWKWVNSPNTPSSVSRTTKSSHGFGLGSHTTSHLVRFPSNILGRGRRHAHPMPSVANVIVKNSTSHPPIQLLRNLCVWAHPHDVTTPFRSNQSKISMCRSDGPDSLTKRMILEHHLSTVDFSYQWSFKDGPHFLWRILDQVYDPNHIIWQFLHECIPCVWIDDWQRFFD